jgi:pimeloyl-ACP methyl ester carboxylesterase
MLAWGELDRFTPMVDEQPLWQRAVPHAESHVLTGVGHIPMFDDPDQTGRLMRSWLDRVASREGEDLRSGGSDEKRVLELGGA